MMIFDVECPECRGNGWVARRQPQLGPGVYEIDCPECRGSGVVLRDEADIAAEHNLDLAPVPPSEAKDDGRKG